MTSICDKEYMLFRTTALFHYQWQTSLYGGMFQKIRTLKKMTEVVSSDTGQVRVHWQRWWILALFSLFTMEQCAIWNTFGPIAQSAEKVPGRTWRLDWNPGVWLDRLNNCLVHLVGLPRLCNLVSSICSCSLSKLKIFCGNISKKTKIYPPTLNLPKVAASFCMLAGACLRCLPLLIPSMESSFTALCHAGWFTCQIL